MGSGRRYEGYFDTIPHGWLMERVGRKIADGKVCGSSRVTSKLG